MVKIIKRLLEKGIAYRSADGSIYFSIAKFPSYGRLSHLAPEGLQAEACFSDEYEKEQVADFVLWKGYDPQRDGDIFWESELGPGRPGWHIECSAMAMSLLGESIDIHVGGIDNMFPHHENEIAQSEAFSGRPFVRYWLHSEHLLVDHKKMSKSLGNFYTLRDLLEKGYTGAEIRYMLLHVHYRIQLNFTLQGLEAARASLERLASFIDRLREVKESQETGVASPIIEGAKKDFSSALFDDLNISVALAAIFELVRQINQLLDQKQLGRPDAEEILALFKQWDSVLGFLPLERKALDISEELQQALLFREKARLSKDWKEADRQRDFILSAGYLIEDTPSGPKLKKK
jgi:cysteinyl-tRNA synthetase